MSFRRKNDLGKPWSRSGKYRSRHFRICSQFLIIKLCKNYYHENSLSRFSLLLSLRYLLGPAKYRLSCICRFLLWIVEFMGYQMPWPKNKRPRKALKSVIGKPMSGFLCFLRLKRNRLWLFIPHCFFAVFTWRAAVFIVYSFIAISRIRTVKTLPFVFYILNVEIIWEKLLTTFALFFHIEFKKCLAKRVTRRWAQQVISLRLIDDGRLVTQDWPSTRLKSTICWARNS